MNYLNTTLINQPIIQSSLSVLGDKSYPSVWAGVFIRDRYNQERITLNKKYSPKDLFHIVKEKEQVSAVYLKAIALPLSKILEPLKKQLAQTPHLTLAQYKNILAEFNLSCNDCFGFFGPGCFPIDDKHIEYVTNNQITHKELYTKVLQTKEPHWQHYAGFSIFILTADPFITNEMKNAFCQESSMHFVD